MIKQNKSIDAVMQKISALRSRMSPQSFFAALAVITLLAVGAAAYFYMQVNKIKKNPQEVVQEEARAIVERVARHIVLPQGETPTIATVTDPERLKGQLFFAKTKMGDKVLIYTNAKKAILYNPTDDKIVEVAPLNIGNQ